MEWENTPISDNIEDRRGGGGGLSVGGGGLGLGTILILTVIGYFTGIDPRMLIGGAEVVSDMRSPAPQSQPAAPGVDDKMKLFVRHILGETEAVWTDALPAQTGVRYQPATLVLYDGGTESGCGGAQAAMGPFYCPLDQRIYLDTAFFSDLQNRFGGCTDSKACQFSEAYVIAHEVGHHVQDELGTLGKATSAQKAASSQVQANAIQVRIELQADCLAGVWANRAQQKHHFLDPGDVDQALQTASAIGDDRLQKKTQGYAVPDSFTHGTSEQRKRWFSNGFKNGDVAACNTFSASSL